MIDTIRLHVPIALTEQALTSDWVLRSTKILSTGPMDDIPVRRDGLLHEHVATGLRAYGTSSSLITVEVSLPRVLHGHDGKLIQNQEIGRAHV